MPTDLASLLHNLRTLHDAGVLDADEYAAKLIKLRTDYGAAAIDALANILGTPNSPNSRTQVVTGAVGVAVAGDVHGNIYQDGRRADRDAQLLSSYMELICTRCSSLPLQALHQQARHDDRHAIGLAAVYTQLAVDNLVEREVLITAQDRTQFDADAYLRDHVGPHMLPLAQRDSIAIADASDVHDVQRMDRFSGGGAKVARIDARELRRMIDNASDAWITFIGPQLVTEAIAANPRLVLLGEPGSGKSTALRFLALTLAEAALDPTIVLPDRLAGWEQLGDQGRLLPLFLPLLPFARVLAKDNAKTGTAIELWNHIAEELEPGGARKGLAEAMHAELSAGRVLVMFDGLDEVVGAIARQKVVQAVAQFAQEHPRCRIVVSCRIRAYVGVQNESWQLPGWLTATLQAWGGTQQQSFIAAWYLAAVTAGSLSEGQRESRVHTLQRAVVASSDLQRLAASPLLLTVMALVHLNDGRLPEDRVTLYSRCIDILLAQWEQRGKDASDYGPLMEYIGLPDRDVQRLRPLLTQTAYTAHRAATPENPGSLSVETLELMATRFLRQLGHPDAATGALKLLEYTDHRAGLLQASTAGDAYAFPHLTFQEYLAGLELSSGIGPVSRIMQHHRDDRWRVPIFLGMGDYVSSGKLEIPYQLLNELLNHPDSASTEAQRDVIFACELTFDVGWDRLEQGGNSFKKLRRDMAQVMATIVEGTALPTAERVHAGVLLGNLGDLRPGVCNLAQMPFVRFDVAQFQIGITSGEYEQIITEETQNNLGDEARRWYERSVNTELVAVAPFALARYPLTNAQYKWFIDAGGYNREAPWWDTAGRAWLQQNRVTKPREWQDTRFGIARPNHPVVSISWYEAIAYCRWLTQHLKDGCIYQLPSELEWEYAARGTERRTYPWGDTEPDNERANFNQTYNGTSTVGCFPTGVTPEGLLDLAGNMWEWTRSEFRPYPYHPNDGREDGTEPAKKRFTLRGGGWHGQSINLRASNRNYNAPDTHTPRRNVGMRLARHVLV